MVRQIPAKLRTARLLLRPWAAADAAALAPILTANAAHFGSWIPAHVSTPLPVPELAERLAGFAADFAAQRAFRFAVLLSDGNAICGEADLFARSGNRRVSLADGDHMEIGYWLDVSVTGRGLATEAASALSELAERLPGIRHIDIRCDPANQPSAAVPRRLGFELFGTDGDTQVWRKLVTNGERSP
jgi:RimJ/RimL family protein N-acetyltransferase